LIDESRSDKTFTCLITSQDAEYIDAWISKQVERHRPDRKDERIKSRSGGISILKTHNLSQSRSSFLHPPKD